MWSEFFITIGAMCGISGFLALLMVIADNTIANYGEVTLTINKEKDLKVEGGKSILSTLTSNDIFIPSACGGRGSCGFCKVKVESDIGDYLPTELPWISPEEKKENIRLSCQCKIKKDISIRIPEEIFNVKEYKTTVKEIKDLTHDIKQVTLKLKEPGKVNFKAGQFVQFRAPEYELSPEPVYRAYSISSPPSQNDEIELEIRLVPDGICTTYVHKYMKEGDEILCNGPFGDFYLRDTDKEIICIAGGSGMAPIKSILMDMAEKKINRKAKYFFGARTKSDLFLVDKMHELEEQLPNFKFYPCLSQPKPEDNWNGETGLITKIVEKYLDNGENTEAYLCGSPGMIGACVEVLNKKGVTDDRIFYDKF